MVGAGELEMMALVEKAVRRRACRGPRSGAGQPLQQRASSHGLVSSNNPQP